jgi:RNA polymerase sigma factor (sigma-70 family)
VKAAVEIDETGMANAFLAGDPETVDDVVTWVKLATWSFRSRLGGDWDDARHEAITQLTQALREGRFRGEGTLKAYVRRVASTTCLDRLRSRRRWRFTALEDDVVPPSPSDSRRHSDRYDMLRLVGRVLAEVPEDCRRLWRMLMEGLSYREMSARCDVSEGALRVRVLRCRQRASEIRSRIEDETANESSPQSPHDTRRA